jgi:hypothetical protein
MRVTLTVDLADLIRSVCALHVYAAELADNGTDDIARDCIAVAERLTGEISRALETR